MVAFTGRRTVEIELPPQSRAWPHFHVSRLKPFISGDVGGGTITYRGGHQGGYDDSGDVLIALTGTFMYAELQHIVSDWE